MLLLAALAPAAFAGHGVYHVDYTDEPPKRILDSVADRWPGYVLEDYRFMERMSPDTAIAMVEKNGHRILAVYRKQNGVLTYWYSTDKAAPQGTGEAWFEDMDGDNFAIVRYDLIGDSYNQYVKYAWQGNSFHLTRYYDYDLSDQVVLVEEEKLSYYEQGAYLDSVYGEFQTDIRYVSFEKLPKTLREARGELTYAPDLPTGKILGSGGAILKAKKIKFTGGRNYPVYLGPGEGYQRSGNGKGTVSTNDWIQVFGKYNGYIMIQYDISADRFRIGWIDAKALPSGANVPDLNLVLIEDYGNVIDKCILTDDPFNSEAPIATLKPGTPSCEIVYNMGGWSYIRVTIDGKDVCGFVPSDCISHG